MPRCQAKKISSQQWKDVKPALERLWLHEKRPLKGPEGIIETMERNHNFPATESQYEAQFRAWKWRRNQTSSVWKHVAEQVIPLQRSGYPWEVLIDGVLQPLERVQKRIRSYISPYRLRSIRAPLQAATTRIVVRPPKLDRGPLTLKLPFLSILNPITPIQTSDTLQAITNSAITGPIAARVDTLCPELGGIVPLPYQQILFSLCNNFAGLESTSLKMAMTSLRSVSSEAIYQFTRSIPGYTSRALAESLLKGAVETGDARLLDVILRNQSAGFDVNKIVLVAERCRWTLIQRAASLRHLRVVSVLISHKADVNKVYEKFPIGSGPLTAALTHHEYDIGSTLDANPSEDLVKMLVDAGGKLSPVFLRNYARDGPASMAFNLMKAIARTSPAKFIRGGTFHFAVRYLDEGMLATILEQTVASPALVNDVSSTLCKFLTTDKVSLTILDLTAARGSLDGIKFLFSHGVTPTPYTLRCAVQSGNRSLITLLVQNKGLDIRGEEQDETSPFGAAIESKNEWAIGFFEGSGVWNSIHQHQQLNFALRAAVKAENRQLILRILQFDLKLLRGSLGDSLAYAIDNEYDEIVSMLLDAAIDRNGHLQLTSEDEVLDSAFLSGSKWLLTRLFDAKIQIPTWVMWAAVNTGDPDIIRIAIAAGASANERGALWLAVDKGNQDIVKLLIAAGANVNQQAAHGGTPLSAAVQLQDMEMVHLLLGYGADPSHSEALVAATSLDDGRFLDLILAEHNLRWPKGRRGFGSLALIKAIRKENVEFIGQLLKCGADCNVFPSAKHAFTPLGEAISFIPEEENLVEHLVERLLREGNGDVHSIVQQHSFWFSKGRECNRYTALVRAVETRNIRTTELLIRHGADVNTSDGDDIICTSLQMAAEVGSKEIVQLLINHGADVNAGPQPRGIGRTALQLAAAKGYLHIVCVLLQHHADVDAPSSEIINRTALEAAAENGRLDIVQMLINAGAGSKIGVLGQNQFEHAARLADEDGHFAVRDLVEDHMRAEEQQARGIEVPFQAGGIVGEDEAGEDSLVAMEDGELGEAILTDLETFRGHEQLSGDIGADLWIGQDALELFRVSNEGAVASYPDQLLEKMSPVGWSEY